MKIVRQRFKCSYYLRDVVYVNNCRKIIIKFGIYLIILFITLLVGILPNILQGKQVIHKHSRFVTDLKYILMWKNLRKNRKNFINHDVKYAEGQIEFIKQNCPYINCYITYNKSLLKSEEFDAVVFNVHDIIKSKSNNLTMPRSYNQLYIFKSFDSAEKHILCKPAYDNFFNWTWTYKLDSDIPHPFFNIFDNKGNKIGPRNGMNWNYDMDNTDKFRPALMKKNKAIATVLGNCNLKVKHRDFLKDFTYEINSYNYSVDVYGPCGLKKCGKTDNIEECDKILDEEYFYQVVLENSIAPDFVSEKVAAAMNRLTIPIIVGGSNLTSFLPPGSYINAKDFNVKKLSAVIDYLLRDGGKYSLFFDWKQYYNYSINPKDNVCELCKKLNERNPEQYSSYKNFRQWWNPDYSDICERMKINKLFHLDY